MQQDALASKDLTTVQRGLLTSVLAAGDQFLGTLDQQKVNAGGKKAEYQPVAVKIADVLPERVGEPASAFEITFPAALLWGVMGCAAGFAI